MVIRCTAGRRCSVIAGHVGVGNLSLFGVGDRLEIGDLDAGGSDFWGHLETVFLIQITPTKKAAVSTFVIVQFEVCLYKQQSR